MMVPPGNMLSGYSSQTAGAPGLRAESISKTAGRTSYSTSMRSRASSAISSVTAATRATASPTYLTFLSRTRTFLGVPPRKSGMSSQVRTALTPGKAWALLLSILLITAWA